MINCLNCNQEITGNYCANCGQATKLKRIDAHYVQHEIVHVLHFEKGIFYTVKELLLRPGKTVQDFILHNRNRLVKPIIFIIISSLVYTLISHFFHVEDGYFKIDSNDKSATVAISRWVQGHYGYANIMMGIFIAFWLKLFFRKSNYNFFEILILLCFVMGIGMLIYSFFALLEGLTKLPILKFTSPIGFIYCFWAIGQFFDRKKISSYLKSIIAYLLGMLTFTCLTLLTGFIVDSIFKH